MSYDPDEIKRLENEFYVKYEKALLLADDPTYSEYLKIRDELEKNERKGKLCYWRIVLDIFSYLYPCKTINLHMEATITIRIPIPCKAALKQKAYDHDMSMSDYVRYLIIKDLEQKRMESNSKWTRYAIVKIVKKLYVTIVNGLSHGSVNHAKTI